MAFTVEQSILIDRSVQEVWDYVVAHNEWRRPAVLEVRKLTDGPDGVGARYENTIKMPIGANRVVNEVTAFHAPTLMAWTQPEPSGPYTVLEGYNILEPLDGRTRFTMKITYQPLGLWRLIGPLIRRRIETGIFPTSLRHLQEALSGR